MKTYLCTYSSSMTTGSVVITAETLKEAHDKIFVWFGNSGMYGRVMEFSFSLEEIPNIGGGGA